ncbi:MAG: hypothetical protein ABR520_04015 [Mycobacteriales bacterium]|nr:hypothetical protein [Frankia sp.]
MSERCDAPIVIESFFTSQRRDTGKRCQRVAAHDGPHRYEPGWDGLPPDVVEERVRELVDKWDEE